MTKFYEQHLDKVWTVTRKSDPQHLSIVQIKKQGGQTGVRVCFLGGQH